MFYNTTAHYRARREYLLTIASQFWQTLAGILEARRARADLSGLDDHLLKDIGISRGNIGFAIRHGRRD